jgi:general secretion pathway protein G
MQKGFTLLEILVVLLILSVIAGLVVPNVLSRPNDARVTVANADIRSISNALELYKLDNFVYPTTAQGLGALVKKPAAPPEPKNWSAGGYLKAMPADPWGSAYQYAVPGKGKAYDLFSFGADGKQGGEGYDADISN